MNILKQRENTHGYYGVTACIAQALKDSLCIGPLDELPPIHRESLDLICTKMARIVNGDHNEIDHWTDIIGYAQLVLNHIKKVPMGSSSIQEPDDEPFDPSVGDNWDYNPRSGHPR